MRLSFRSLSVMVSLAFLAIACTWMFAPGAMLANWGIGTSPSAELMARRGAALYAGLSVMFFVARGAAPSPARAALVAGFVTACALLAALGIGELPEPQVRDDDVLVEVHAAGVNLLDAKIRRGEFKLILPYRFPLVLGNDVAGVVLRVGAGVRRFKPGDAVYARPDQTRIGSFAERIAVKESALALKPANLGMQEAASVPLVALTAWQALVGTARLQKGQKVLIHAGSGGVGSVAIQLAKHLGAYVATTTGTGNVGWVKALGADLVIGYRTQDFATAVRDYDVVLNSLGRDVLEKSLRVLKPGGKLISISGPPDPDFAVQQGLAWPLRQVMRLLSGGIRRKARRHGVGYAFLFMTANGEQLREIGALIEAGIIRPVLDRVFPLEQTAQALAYVESGRAKGKVVIRVGQR